MDNIKNWLTKYGFTNINLSTGDDFAFDLATNTIIIGVKQYPDIGRYFEQFLYEYGMEYSGIYDSVLAFLHELGHAYTINYFTIAERYFYMFAKEFDHTTSEQEWFNYYWSVPDEFAANIWVVNFVNTYIEAVEELCNVWR